RRDRLSIMPAGSAEWRPRAAASAEKNNVRVARPGVGGDTHEAVPSRRWPCLGFISPGGAGLPAPCPSVIRRIRPPLRERPTVPHDGPGPVLAEGLRRPA